MDNKNGNALRPPPTQLVMNGLRGMVIVDHDSRFIVGCERVRFPVKMRRWRCHGTKTVQNRPLVVFHFAVDIVKPRLITRLNTTCARCGLVFKTACSLPIIDNLVGVSVDFIRLGHCHLDGLARLVCGFVATRTCACTRGNAPLDTLFFVGALGLDAGHRWTALGVSVQRPLVFVLNQL